MGHFLTSLLNDAERSCPVSAEILLKAPLRDE
jgi:hypothetical protein